MGRSRVTLGASCAVAGLLVGLLALVPDTGIRLLLLTTVLAVTGACLGTYIHRLLEAGDIDHTTGLLNRRAFVRHLDAEVARAQRHHRSFALVLMDIDNFKRYNDRYGHLTGDMVLRTFSHIARGVVRTSDLVARWGGEEFALILPETGHAGAIAVAQRVRQRLAAETLPNGSPGVTLSGGVACFPEDADDSEGLVSAADSALYRAKASGNEIVLFSRAGYQ
ncbi:MAG TPA: hypothetical protein DCM14_06335 [Clostridiales bacterium UBA8153]|nr:hypothetical protein [Clostridiales bacterium UBA8153]